MGQPPLLLGAILGLFALFFVVTTLTLADALYQVIAARPSFLPLQRLISRRVPATEQDCVVEGAAKALLAIAMVVFEIPIGIDGVVTFMSPWAAPSPLAQLPRPIFVVLMLAWLGCFLLAMTAFLVSLALSLRVRYLPVSREVAVH